jgi:hypothetical protein
MDDSELAALMQGLGQAATLAAAALAQASATQKNRALAAAAAEISLML